MGVKEQIIFPEIDFDAVDAIRGMDIAITTTAKTDAEAKALLAAFKFRSVTDLEETEMAKTSMVNRDIKREKLAKKYAEKRAALKKIVSSVDATYEEKIEAATKLAKLPRDSSPSRQRNRCELSGRPRGVYASSAWAVTAA